MADDHQDPAVDLAAAEAEVDLPPLGATERYDAMMQVMRNRVTVRKFAPGTEVPAAHVEMILEAARHAPSGANAQPWHFIVVREQGVKDQITEYFVAEQRARAKMKMKFPTPDYRGLATAPGFIVVASDMRWVRAFPVLQEDDSDLNRMYRENAERILLQSVAASTMSAHLAAAALGYCVWWVTAIGQENAQKAMKPLLGIPDELSVLDIMLFGQPAQRPYKRWRKPLPDILNWDRFDPANLMTDADIDDWIHSRRHRVMYKDASKID